MNDGIRISGVTKAYKNGPRAVDDVTLDVHEGEFMVLVGPSGCGKSTLLKMIAGIEERVREAAELLDIGRLLERKPGQLSGGQAQRVALGRALVREPQAFLMDEPLSNLDAKLRVSMRSQLSRLHERLGVTTVYVTHDQVEAMTLGQRVAVLRGGVLQQCDTPQALFEHPANLFVAAFIGSPAMNLVEAVAEDGEARFGSCRLRSPFRGRFILGVRPHDLKLGAPGLAGQVQVVERLGTETHVVVGIDAPRLRSRTLQDAVDAAPDDDVLLAEDDRASFTVVTEARTPLAVGDSVELSVDPSRVYGFDVETGAALDMPARAPVAA